MMKHSVLLFVLSLCLISCEKENSTKTLLVGSDSKKIKVYLLGTFHFAQTDSDYNVLDDKHQKSIEKLSQAIAKQKPDKVFVERQPEFESSNKIDSLYGIYLKLTRPIRAKNEIFQVGFRVAKTLGHKKVYQCDHPGQYGVYIDAVNKYAEKNNQNDILDGKRLGSSLHFDGLIDEDSLFQNSSLFEYMKWLNSEEAMRISQAYYITNFPQIGSSDYYQYDNDETLIGAELTVDWYRRNILIYTKMINQVDYEKDRAIFLIMGCDHIPIIENLFDDNPNFEVVKPDQWLI